MRTLLVTGPGGAGSSTVAAATALALAGSGERVVLLAAAPPPVDGLGGTDGVDVRVVQAGPALEAAWAGHADALAALVPVLTLPPATSVVPPPGAGTVALLTGLGRVAGAADVVVVDAGPLPQALELLALPGAARWWLAQLAPPRLRVLASVRALTGKGRAGAVDAALAAVAALEAALAQVPEAPEVHVVVAPDGRAVPAVRRAGAAAGLLGHPLASVTLARVLPAGAGEWATARAAVQDRVRAELAGFAVREVAEAPVPPSDVPGLRALGAELPGTVPEPLPVPRARREGAGWVLPVPLPGAGRGEVELTRWSDELVVGLAGLRRSLPLDPLLRRCTVTGASVQHPGTPDAVLAVAFAPDPAQWPADLLAAEGAR